MPELYSFEDNDHFFIKFFVLDATLNLNKWGVTEYAMKSNLDTFIGKPFVLTPDADHPSGTPDTLLQNQEEYRVGTIIEVGYDAKSGKAFGVAEITDRNAQDMIKSGEISFVSPSIIFEKAQTRYLIDGSKVIEAFEGAHVAGVKDPAFGMYKAQIKGKCSGEKATCEKELALVQASKEGQIRTFSSDGQTFMIQAQSDECVERWIKELSGQHDDWDRDQIIAVAFEKCRTGSGNIDPQSLENITQVNMPAKPDKKCGSSPDMPCTEENASLKQKNAKSSLMTKAQNEEEKKKEEYQCDEEKDAMDEEEKKKMDAMDEEEKKKMDAQDEDEDKKEEGQDEEEKKKDNQEARIRDLEVKLANKDKQPLVSQIVDAKIQLGYMKELGSEKASKTLYDLPLSMLKSMAADYARMAEATKSPKFPYEMVQASREGNSMDADKLLARLKR